MARDQRVLVVTEDAEMAALLPMMLSRLPGVQPVVAKDAAAGLDLAARERLAVIVLDLGHGDRLPAERCFERAREIVRRFRAVPGNGHVPLIGTCFRCEAHDLVGDGLSAVVPKPFEMDYLLTTVRELLPGSQSAV